MTYRWALECSTSRGSVALAEAAGPVLWQTEFSAGRGQGGQLFTALERAVREIRTNEGKLALLVVGLGPGSYSGVRQAVAAAVGLAAATGASLVSAPSPLALAFQGPGAPAVYRAVSDARRGTFYHTAVRDGVCLEGPEILPDAAALAACLAADPGWPVFAVEAPLPDELLPDIPVVFPDAAGLLGIPEKSHRLPPLEPIYLRPVSITLPKSFLLIVP